MSVGGLHRAGGSTRARLVAGGVGRGGQSGRYLNGRGGMRAGTRRRLSCWGQISGVWTTGPGRRLSSLLLGALAAWALHSGRPRDQTKVGGLSPCVGGCLDDVVVGRQASASQCVDTSGAAGEPAASEVPPYRVQQMSHASAPVHNPVTALISGHRQAGTYELQANYVPHA